jgi:hypothetical protein
MFCIFVVIAYAKPVIENQQVPIRITQNTTDDALIKQYKSSNLPENEFSRLIGKKLTSEINQKYQKKKIQLIADDNAINQIVITKNDKELFPLAIGQTLTNLSKQIEFQTHIEFSVKGKNYFIDLTDIELNYFPIVKYSNQVFAILTFDKNDGKLLQIRFLNADTLFEQSSYKTEIQEDKIKDN